MSDENCELGHNQVPFHLQQWEGCLSLMQPSSTFHLETLLSLEVSVARLSSSLLEPVGLGLGSVLSYLRT